MALHIGAMGTLQTAGGLARPPSQLARSKRLTPVALRLVAAALLVALGSLVPSGSSWAHGGDETQEGYLLVQQSLAYLAQDRGPNKVDLAMEKVDDALAAPDQVGVTVPEVMKARKALESRDIALARDLLQDSINSALKKLPPATGNETGTTVVAPDLPGRLSLTGTDWFLLVVSGVLVTVGLGLSYRFRPADSLPTLRRALGTPGARPIGTDHGSITPRRNSR